MKRILAPLFCAVILAAGAMAAESKSASQRFYGKIVSIDQVRKELIVHNSKQKLDASFKWSEETAVVKDKKETTASDLKVGQSLIISYLADANMNRATRISVRTPFQKSVEQ